MQDQADWEGFLPVIMYTAFHTHLQAIAHSY